MCMSKYCWHGWIWRLQMKSDKCLVGVKSFDIYSWLRVSLKQAKILNYIHFPNCVSFAWFCLSYLDKLKDKVKKWEIKLCTCCKIWLTWLTLVFLVRETGFTWLTLFFIFRECLNFFEHMCVRKAGWLAWLRVGSKIYICTFRETWLTWLTLIFIIRGGLKFWIYVCRKRWLTSLT